jgi:hypothetical protein
MASADLSRRVRQVVGYSGHFPILSGLSMSARIWTSVWMSVRCLLQSERQYHSCVRNYGLPSPPDTAPLVRLREQLAAAREDGELFGDAWPIAVTSALTGLRGRELSEWKVVLDRTAEAWERSYTRQPATKVDKQMSLIGAEREVSIV